MGHIVNHNHVYHLLQQRLDRNVEGAPNSPTFMKILKLLFSPEEAELAKRMPLQPTSLDVLSRKLDIPSDKLNDKMTEMAHRGLIFDFENDGKRYFSLPPVVTGFWDFTFMRIHDDIPMADLARLFENYLTIDDRFARSHFQGQTQLYRSLVHEEALPDEAHTEILDFERVSHIVKSASAIAVGLCCCRHQASHLGKACNAPLQTCLSFNLAAKILIQNGIAQHIKTDEALRILKECKEAGLAQLGDNVQRNISYICNCCSCCCQMFKAVKLFNIRNGIVTSNWIMEIDFERCTGCGKCAKACPINAIEIVQKEEGKEKEKRTWAVCNKSICLGCGVCYSVCKFGAISMKPRTQRVFTPETIFDRTVSMAIERGKLTNLLFEDPTRLSHKVLERIVSILEKSPPFKAAMAIKPLRSAFLSMIVKEAKRKLGKLSKIFE